MIQWRLVDTRYTLSETPWCLRGQRHYKGVSDVITDLVRSGASPGQSGFYMMQSDVDPSRRQVTKALEESGLLVRELFGSPGFKLTLSAMCIPLIEPTYVLKANAPKCQSVLARSPRS